MPKGIYERKNTNNMGRPKGTTEFSEPKIKYTHTMTPKAHRWILKFKKTIEIMAEAGQGLDKFVILEGE